MSLSASSERTAGWHFENSYVRLPQDLFDAVNPVPVRSPKLVIVNHALARSLGLDPEVLALDSSAGWFTGNELPPGAQPIAQAYAGHQFGNLTMLGDGRAVLLGEQRTPDGQRFDIQLKGSGRTPYSRRGDGRAALGPMLREYIISEAMFALGIPTTRSLSVAATGETVQREEALPGAVLTRVAASHIRVGTFEYVARIGNPEAHRIFTDYALKRHDADIAEAPDRFFRFFQNVADRQASLLARWMLVGFVHGVMNTDNMAISGETIDYGPCAFLDTYHPDSVFSSIDLNGRYAFSNQPAIAQWNLTRLAETLLPFLDDVEERAIQKAKEVLEAFPGCFQEFWLQGMRAKLGLFSGETEDLALANSLLDLMKGARADFTNTFRGLHPLEMPKEGVFTTADFQEWHRRWTQRLSRQDKSTEEVLKRMRAHNPAVIPRNHRVEEVLVAAVEANDFSPLRKLLHVLAEPYAESAEMSDFREPPPPGAPAYQTFCGT